MARKRRTNPDRPIETFKVGDKTVEMYYDDNPESPREWDNLGKILYLKGARYTLGDEGVTIDEIKETAQRKDVVFLPVYTLIHGGIAMKTTDFRDPWDSGQSGIIFVTHDDIKKEYKVKRITEALKKKVREVLRGEVKTFGEYLNGEVYGYVITDAEGEHVDSLWGMFDYDYAKKEATDAAKAMG